MKTRMLVFSVLSGFVVLIVYLLEAPKSAQADEVPEKYRPALKKGLDYLIERQHKDGHWEGAGGKQSVELTALAGLALLMNAWRHDTDIPRYDSTYVGPTRRAAEWLAGKCQSSGLIYSGHAAEAARYMQGHGLATMFLAGLCRDEACHVDVRRKKSRDVLERAVKYILKGQSTQGGWYHTSRTEGHDFAAMSSTIIQVQALQAAEIADIELPAAAIVDGVKYLIQEEAKLREDTKAKQPLSDVAGTVACRRGGLRPDPALHDPATIVQLSKLFTNAEMKLGPDDLVHFYYAQLMFKMNFPIDGPRNWEKYRSATFDRVMERQTKDGSWPAGDGFAEGPIASTALWCIVLQLDHWSYPTMSLLALPRN